MFGKCEFAAVVALIHRADLRHANMAFICENNGIIWDELKQCWGRLPGRAACEIARIIFNPAAYAGGFKHFKIEICALFQPLSFQQLALVHQLIQPHPQLLFDTNHGLLHGRARGNIVTVGVDPHPFKRIGACASQRIKLDNGLQLFAKKAQTPSPVVQMRRPNFQTVSTHAKGAALESLVIASILLCNQISNDLALVIAIATVQILGHRPIGFDRPYAIDAGHRSHDNDIIAFQQSAGRRVAHPIDLLIDLAFFLNVGVRAGHIGFGLIIVVIADEIFHRVVRKKPFELAIKLCCEGFVRRKNNRWALGVLYDPRHGEGLACARGSEQDLTGLARIDAPGQLFDGGGLVACCGELGLKSKRLAPFHLFPVAHIRSGILQDGYLFGRIIVHF